MHSVTNWVSDESLKSRSRLEKVNFGLKKWKLVVYRLIAVVLRTKSKYLFERLLYWTEINGIFSALFTNCLQKLSRFIENRISRSNKVFVFYIIEPIQILLLVNCMLPNNFRYSIKVKSKRVSLNRCGRLIFQIQPSK